jgi:hypothetical protein
VSRIGRRSDICRTLCRVSMKVLGFMNRLAGDSELQGFDFLCCSVDKGSIPQRTRSILGLSNSRLRCLGLLDSFPPIAASLACEALVWTGPHNGRLPHY